MSGFLNQWLVRAPLNWVARAGISRKSSRLLKFALKAGADPDAFYYPLHPTRARNLRLLHAVCAKEWPTGLRALLEWGANTEVRGGRFEGTPLFLALEIRGDLQCARMLAEYGADPDGKGVGIDMNVSSQTMNVLGWDYPNMKDILKYREMSVEESASYYAKPEYMKILHIARNKRLEKMLDKTTAPAPGSARTPTRL